MSNQSVALVWETADIWGVVKPAGLPCFPPHDNPSGDSVFRRICAQLPMVPDAWPLGFDGGIAHRLDTSTSGLLLVARSVSALAALREQFSDKSLDKRYHFLTARNPPWDENVVNRPIAHARRKNDRVVVQRGADTPHRGRWREAETRFRRIAAVDGGLWLWEARMKTGVMHQIRVHAAFVGLSLAGDTLYGGGGFDAPRPPGTTFALHHLGLRGPGVQPPVVGVPAWWPARLPKGPTSPPPAPRKSLGDRGARGGGARVHFSRGDR